tara:strand:- start:89 stop:388 length:300 start_codon:yes stop_codon:yes gene_type:complete
MCLSYNRKNSMSASFVTDSSTKERELNNVDIDKENQDKICEGVSNLEFLKEKLEKRSDNLNPKAEYKEKTDKILYLINTAFSLSESQESDDGLRQGKED